MQLDVAGSLSSDLIGSLAEQRSDGGDGSRYRCGAVRAFMSHVKPSVPWRRGGVVFLGARGGRGVFFFFFFAVLAGGETVTGHLAGGPLLGLLSRGTSEANLPDEVAEPLVVMEKVNKFFGALQALRDVDLTIDAGEVVVVIGPSGSGKSTLCRTINRLEPIDSGRILVDGRPIPEEGRALARAARRRRHGLPVVQPVRPQDGSRQRHARPDQGAQGAEGGGPGARTELLERVGIADKADRYPAELSGGQQQRAAIARALAMEPKLMLFDEPTSALDPEMIKEVLDVMHELAAEGTTMLVVSHEMGFARSAAHRVVFMDEGAIVESAAPDQFFSAPESDRARDFLSKILVH